MIVEFMYQSSYHRSGKSPKGPRNVKRLLWVSDPYFGRQAGGGDDVDSRGFYMWGIDLEKITPTQFLIFAARPYDVQWAGPKIGARVQPKHPEPTVTRVARNLIPIIDIPGMNGLAKWDRIKGIKALVENYRSYDIDRIKGCHVVQYNFTDIQYKMDFTAPPKPPKE